jgi:hypothetical protein
VVFLAVIILTLITYSDGGSIYLTVLRIIFRYLLYLEIQEQRVEKEGNSF